MMNLRTIKLFLGLFLGVLCVFLGFMLAGRHETGKPAARLSAGAQAARSLAEARAGAGENPPVPYRTGLTTGSVRSEGAIAMVKSGEFSGVAEEPQGMMEMLTDMSGSNKKKRPPVYLTDKDLEKKIMVDRAGLPEPSLSASVVPGLGQSAAGAAGGKTMFTAPVDYKIFRDLETWKAFASTHQGHYPPVDFSREEMLILVSLSDLPSGIFKIEGLKKSAKETVVLYRVDPLAMASGNEAKEQNYYSAAAVPKAADIKLEQVP
ncbi:MAG: hypothetical protein WCW52_12370 [Elusimicrobiales bacterium]|jgi:hypothetical protein